MKRLFCMTLALSLTAFIVNAQGVRLGAKLGANMNKVDGQSFDDGYDLGYHVGGFLEIDFNKRLGIQPEVYFNQSTTTRTNQFGAFYQANPNASTKVKLNYLSIPILLRINLGKIATLNLGPQFSVLMSDNKNMLQNGQEAFKGGDLAAAGGLTLNLKMLRVYGRYNIGLSNINDIDNQDKWKNQQLQLGLGLRL